MRARERAVALGGLAVLAASVWLVGGAMRWTEAIVAAIAALALVVQSLSRRGFARPPLLLVGLGIAIALTALQLIPLPTPVVDVLQPTGSALRSEGAELLGVSYWNALTLDAPGTFHSLCFLVILFGVARIALWISTTESGRYRVLAGVGAICGMTACIVGVHQLLGAKRLYGIYEPMARPSVLGPLLNENHLGSLMALGTSVAIGLAMHGRQRSWLRSVWFLVAAACAVTAVASQSRGAAIAMIAGVLITGGIVLAQRLTAYERRRTGFLTGSLPIAIVMVCAVVVVIYAGAGGVSEQLARTSLDAELHHPKSKFSIWRSSVTLVEEAPWFGVGRGAFEPAFTRVHPASAVASFSHVENEYVQVVVEWGLVGALLLGAVGVWLIVVVRRRWRDGALTAGAIGGFAAVAGQSTVDFGVQLLGVAVPMIAVMATLTYVPLRELPARTLQLVRGVRLAHAVVLVAVCFLLLSSATATIADDHAELQADSNASLAKIRQSIERHPLDYYGYARAAEVLTRTGDPQGVRVLNHALRLHPTHPGLHYLAARLLIRAKAYDQAALEYAAALRSSPAPRPLVAEVLQRFSARQAPTAIPIDYPDLDQMVKALIEQSPSSEVASRWLERVLATRPGNTSACTWLYAITLKTWDPIAVDAASKHCADVAPGVDTRVAIARHQLKVQHYDEVLKLLYDVESWEGRIDFKTDAWLIVCDTRIARAEWDLAKTCLRRLDLTDFASVETHAAIRDRLDQIEKAMRAATEPAPTSALTGSGSASK